MHFCTRKLTTKGKVASLSGKNAISENKGKSWGATLGDHGTYCGASSSKCPLQFSMLTQRLRILLSATQNLSSALSLHGSLQLANFLLLGYNVKGWSAFRCYSFRVRILQMSTHNVTSVTLHGLREQTSETTFKTA